MTGAASGIGLATAQAFARAGAAIVPADRDETVLHAVTGALAREGHRTLAVACDVSDEAQAASMIEQTVAALPARHGLQQCRQSRPDVSDDGRTRSRLRRSRGRDLCRVWTSIKHELRQMTKQGHGSIVNCSSLGGLIGLPGRDACHATKHDVTGLTRSAALTTKQFLRTSRSAGLAVRRNRRDRSFGSAVLPPASF